MRSSWRLPGAAVLAAAIFLSVLSVFPEAQSAPQAGRGRAATPQVTWLTDTEGRQYRIDKLPKAQAHKKLPDGRLRTVWGFTVDLTGEDETTYWVKVYRVVDTPKPAPAGPTRAELAAIADSYRVATKASRRLQFEPFDRGLPRSGQWRNGFVIADINNDGHPDIVHGPARKRPGPPVVFLGNGRGDWRRWTEASFPQVAYDYGDVAVADFDGNGHLDIAMGMHLLGMTALLNDGTGRFTVGHAGMGDAPAGNRFSSRAILAVDWTADGRPDIVALGEGPRLAAGPGGGADAAGSGSHGLRLYTNAGRGVWTSPTGTPGTLIFGDALAALRTIDGQRAIVAGSSRVGSTDLLFVADGAGSWVIQKLQGVRPMALVGAVTVADFDGDGADDIAIGYRSFEGQKWRSGVDVLLQQPGGAWQRRALFVEDVQDDIGALASGDLTGDGLPDLAVGTGDGRVVVLLNSGKGVFTREAADPKLSQQSPGCRVYRLAVADLDRDGRSELVASFAGEPEGMLTLNTAGCPGEGSLRAWRSKSSSVRPGS